jgi:hypothetical protein
LRKLAGITILVLAVMCVAALPAAADTAFSDLGNPPTYNCCSGWTVGGVNSPVGLIRNANQFTSLTTGDVNQIDVGLGWVTGTNAATISLWSSVGDLPGSELGSWMVTDLPVFGSTSTTLASITGISGIHLDAGTQYFLVIEAADDAWEAWNENTQNVTGLLLQDSGSGWNSFPGSTLGAFDVLTGSGGVPEPGTFLMMGSGVLAAAGVFRRKINL